MAERCNFDFVWTSGFSISLTQYGLPDANLLTLTENVDVARRIAQQTNLPVISDIENGYGDHSNVFRAAKEFYKAGVRGISIEDQTFPKKSALYKKANRYLIPVDDMVKKIKAARSAQTDLFIIGRTDALVSSLGIKDALSRATAYSEAGADALLIQAPSYEVLSAFCKSWNRPTPLVSVLTLFPGVSLEQIRSLGIRLAIYAHLPLAITIKALESALNTLKREQSAAGLLGTMATANELSEFRDQEFYSE